MERTTQMSGFYPQSVTTQDIEELAHKHGLTIQHECGGYRVVKARDDGGRRDIFPTGGICPTVARLACYIFLLGVSYGKEAK